MNPIHVLIALALLPIAAAASPVGPIPRAMTYPVPDAVSDSPYTVTVDGKTAPIERAGALQGAYYVRLRAVGRVGVSVSTKSASEFALKPERLRENVKTSDSSISFDVSSNGPRVITAKSDGKDLWPLIVIVDDVSFEKQAPKGDAVFNVADYGVTSTGIQTARIQKALDDCAARKGGGVVYFGPGAYHTGTIRIGDNTTVYLAAGALIIGSTDPNDYPVDPGFTEVGTHGPVCSNSRLIMFDHCTNSSIKGYGVIDGMGHIVRNKHKRHVQLVDVTGSRSIRIENVVLRNSAEWTLHILGCDRVTVDNLKIINDWGVSNTDGIDPDCSRDVFVSRYFGFCGDDAVAIKTTGNSKILRPCVNIEFKDCVVMTRKTSYKIGTETYDDIRDVLFERCEAINSSRGIAMWECDGHTISDVVYKDMKLDLREFKGEGWSGEPIHAIIEERHGVGTIKDIRFERVFSSSPYRSGLWGHAKSRLSNFAFSNCEFVVKPREEKMGKQPIIEIKNATSFSFEDITLKWLTNDPANWSGFLSEENTEGIVVRNLRETGSR